MGINAFPLPHAMVTNNHNGRDPFNKTSFWNQYGDPSGPGPTTLTTFIPDGAGHRQLRGPRRCFVREVKIGNDGKANGVVYIDPDGNEVEQDAKVVILARARSSPRA